MGMKHETPNNKVSFNLRQTATKHKDDFVGTGGVVLSAMATDAADEIDRLEQELSNFKNFKRLGCFALEKGDNPLPLAEGWTFHSDVEVLAKFLEYNKARRMKPFIIYGSAPDEDGCEAWLVHAENKAKAMNELIQTLHPHPLRERPRFPEETLRILEVVSDQLSPNVIPIVYYYE